MSAIITENFRRNNTRLFLNDISNHTAGKYYLGIGKQDRWSSDEENIDFSVPVAVGTRADALEVLNNLNTLVSLNALSGIARVIPSVPWKNGNTYQAYNSYNSDCFYPSGGTQPCYVTINGAIFLCLKAGSGTSTVSPSVQTSKYTPFTLSDGYIWALVQEATPASIITNNTFTDVRTTPLSGAEETNSVTQCGGVVTGFTIVSGGEDYTSSSVLKLRTNDGFASGDAGDDRSSTFIALDFTVDTNGAIDTISFPAGWPAYSGSDAAIGARFASIEFSGPGTGASIIPTIAPPKGFAYDPSVVMPSWFAGLKISLEDSIFGDNFYSRYRQISIIKNINVPAGKETAESLNTLKYIQFPSDTAYGSSSIAYTNPFFILNSEDAVIGYADYYDGANQRLYFHQNNTTGYRELPSSGTLKISETPISTPVGIYPYTSINNNEFINDGNAEVLFTENRSFITRASGQTEDLIIIIQF